MAQLHRNPRLNEFFQRHLCEDGVIRIPKEARDALCDIAEEDVDRFLTEAPYTALPDEDNTDASAKSSHL